MTDQVPYDDLDPNIRRLVKLLNDHGFDTCDSGDGKSKFSGDHPLESCAMDIPNVLINCEPSQLATECDRVRDVLKAAGIEISTVGPDDDACVQGTYDPAADLGRSAFIMVLGIDDSRFPSV